MENKLITMASEAKYKPQFILASLLSLTFVILGSSFSELSYLFDIPTYLSLALFDLGIGFAMITLVCFLYVKVIEKRSIASMGFEKEGAYNKYIRGFGLGFLLFALAVIFGVVTGAYKIELSLGDANLAAITVILFGFIIQGGAEEVVFRGWLLPIVGARYTLLFGVIVSSLMFAFLHGANPGITILPVINLVLFGVFAAVYALNEKSLWGICGFHSSWNWVQGSIFGVKVSGTTVPGGSVLKSIPQEGFDFLSGGAFGIEGSIFCTLMFLLPILLIIRKMKDDK